MFTLNSHIQNPMLIKLITKHFQKIRHNILIIYNYINSLCSKSLHLILIDPVYERTILNDLQNIIPKYLNLPRNSNSNPWTFNNLLKIYPLIINDTLITFSVVSPIDNTFYLLLYQLHGIPIV